LEELEKLVNPERVVPTTIEIVDIAGLVKGASKGEGLGNQFLGNIRETDAMIHVLRCFDDGNIVQVDGSVDPVRDKDIIDTELQLKDLETVEKRLQALQKSAKGGDKEILKSIEIVSLVLKTLESGKSARTIEIEEESQYILDGLQLLTAKPVLYVCNVDEGSVKTGNKYVEEV